MYHTGDKIIHPMHGAGIVSAITERTIGGEKKQYYELKLSSGGMVVLSPVQQDENSVVRPVTPRETMLQLLEALPGLKVEMTANWNQRYRDNMLRLKSGNLTEVARVIKGLTCRGRQRDLSNGERRMLRLARHILISEMVLSLSAEYDDAAMRLDMALL